MACRFFLAVAEAGFSPGIPYLLSFFYTRQEIGLRIGMFLSAAPLATCFAGALAYGITSSHLALASWRFVFIVEAIPAIVLAVVSYFFLPDCPENARFLTEEEKAVARARSIRQVGGEGKSRLGSISPKEAGEALVDPKNWIIAVWLQFPGLWNETFANDVATADVLLLQCVLLLASRLHPCNSQRVCGLKS
jgi:MFS family permease